MNRIRKKWKVKIMKVSTKEIQSRRSTFISLEKCSTQKMKMKKLLITLKLMKLKTQTSLFKDRKLIKILLSLMNFLRKHYRMKIAQRSQINKTN